MTTITKITAKGFKSFANKTELVFGDRYNVVLGPNGSGKSNIVDLICFVLGKASAKSLRAEKSANLIFNGGKKGKPAQEAEATIEFSNKDKRFSSNEEQIKVTRILKQTGNSIYKINDKTCTRQQILDLLNTGKIDPDGHNILLQGDVVHFMEMKPIERRQIIDQISGISIYEEKKIKCLEELQKVDSKLNEAEIILTEREANLRELKKERDQAVRYKQLQQNLMDYKATHVGIRLKSKNDKLDELEKNYKEQESRIQQTNKIIEELRNTIQEHKNNIKLINSEIEEKGEKEQLIIRKEIEELKTNIIKTTTRQDVCNKEIEKIKTRRQQLLENIKGLENKISEINKQKELEERKLSLLRLEQEEIEKDINEFKNRYGINNIQNINNDLEEQEQNIEKILKEIGKFQEEKQKVLKNKHQLEFQLESTKEKILSIKGTSKSEDIQNLKNLKQKFKETTFNLTKSLNEDSSLAAQLQSLRQNLLNSNEELAKLITRRASIREKTSGDIATRKILELRNKIKGIHGAVSELGQIQSKYALALEIAAGPRIQSIVVEDDSIAQKCINYLKENKLGTATFLPLNKIKYRQISNEVKILTPKTEGLAIELIKYNPKYKDVFSYVLGSTLVIKDITLGRKIGIGNARMVTLDGDLLEASGAMVGGYKNKSRGYGFKEEEVDINIIKLEKEIESYQNKLNITEKKRLENETILIKLRETKVELEAEIIQLEKTLGLNETNLEKLRSEEVELEEKNKLTLFEQKQIEEKIIKLNSELLESKGIKNKIREKLSNPTITKKLEELESKKLLMKSDAIEIVAHIKNFDLQVSSVFGIELSKSFNILKQHEKEFEEFSKENLNLKEILKERQKELKEKENIEKKYYGQFKESILKRNKLEEKIQQREVAVLKEEERINSIQQKANNTSIEKAKINAEIEGLNKELDLLQDYKIKRGFSLEDLNTIIRDTEKEVSKIGSVNLRALEVYEDIEKELNTLLEKVTKLRTEKDDVLVMVFEIEDKKKSTFIKTYNKVDKTFKDIFKSLTTKGEAHMELENPDNIFDAGIDFKVKVKRG